MVRVMLVDDEEDALNLLEILLGQIGGVEIVGKYSNALLALERIAQLPVDAIFLDNQMPGIRGMDAARAIREQQPHMQIVFVTAYAEYAVEAFEIRSTDYLLKPYSKERLRDAVARIRQTLSGPPADGSLRTRAAFSIQCMGGFHIYVSNSSENRTLPWKTRKERELCAYLIHHEGKAVSAASIIEAIWPEYDLGKAKTYLYTCLSYLRKNLADHQVPLRIRKTDLGFAAEFDGLTVDAVDFERLLHTALSDEAIANEKLTERIVQYYAGEYMEGCDFDWAFPRQLELRGMYIRALRKGYALCREQNRTGQAIACLQRVLALAPDSEADGRELIRLYLEADNRTEALRVFHQLEQAVREQLGVELEEGTLKLIGSAGGPALAAKRWKR